MCKLPAGRVRLHSRLNLSAAEEQSSTLFFRSIEPDNCISQINRCRTLTALKSVHASMLRCHLHLNLFFSTNLLSHYASLGSITHAHAVFCTSSSSDPFLWNAMIQAFSDNAHYDRCLSLYRRMRDSGVPPDNFTFPFVLKACSFFRAFPFGIQVHGDVVSFGCESNGFVCNSLVAMYGKCERMEMARQLFDEMPERNVVSWSSIMGACAQNGYFEDGLFLFSRMLDEKLRPSRVAVLSAMACVGKENQADHICGVVRGHGLDSDQSVQNAAMRMYTRCGRIDVARRLFDEIPIKDLMSWTSMIEAYAQAALPWEALELFEQMRLQGIVPDSVTLLSVIRACSSLASYLQARLIHGYVTRCFSKNRIALETAIIDLYVKCGSLEYARKVFDLMHTKNLISWSTIISGYGMHGCGREALLLFDQMKASIKPDHITFVSVLSACSHSGLISEGWTCFNSMSRDFELTPRPEHYACMVDLLGRAGKLMEAQAFIERMPIAPDIGVWGALLGACRVHLNVELAEMAAKSLISLDAHNPGRYVLLSNIYASSGKRKEANWIRILMKCRGVRKTAGHTIIEIKNKLYTFVAGEKSNPQADLIHMELEKMMDRIQQDGHVPDLNFVLHDVE
ncbi:pentatricopeptide repeat-containing protein At3g12770-like [Malania oleifera]|uniref:pentatricopeptide repeat-containing protein At3g12770-like n=1 Tax=Malania oleifera TaxID=397392 RepID=UPI0025ADD6A3|nr:pentatricopeptide repeat-containing protein At3g12770-like [Malania oleifera]